MYTSRFRCVSPYQGRHGADGRDGWAPAKHQNLFNECPSSPDVGKQTLAVGRSKVQYRKIQNNGGTMEALTFTKHSAFLQVGRRHLARLDASSVLLDPCFTPA